MRHCYGCKKTLHKKDDWCEVFIAGGGTAPVILCESCARLASKQLANPVTDTGTPATETDSAATGVHNENMRLEQECNWLAEQIVEHEKIIQNLCAPNPQIVVVVHSVQEWRKTARAVVAQKEQAEKPLRTPWN